MGWIIFLLMSFLCLAPAIEVISEKGDSPRWIDQLLPVGTCVELHLGRERELPIYKDFTLLGMLAIDPRDNERVTESPLIGKFSGQVHLNRLGPPRKLKNLAFLSRMVERRDRRKSLENFFVPVMLCGDDSYQGSLGYFEVDALRIAREDDFGDQMPPSVGTNPIPALRRDIN